MMSENNNSDLYKKSIINSLAGLCGNFATGLFYPLELIKLRLQGRLIPIEKIN
jgi:hypothetical protein